MQRSNDVDKEVGHCQAGINPRSEQKIFIKSSSNIAFTLPCVSSNCDI